MNGRFAIGILIVIFFAGCIARKVTQAKKSMQLIQGAWFGKEYEEHAVFLIDGDSITYIEHFDKFKFKIKSSVFDIISADPHHPLRILILRDDSLVFQDSTDGEILRYGRNN